MKPFGLLYAMPTEGELHNANKDDIFVGSMFWDDGDQIELKDFLKINFFGSKVYLGFCSVRPRLGHPVQNFGTTGSIPEVLTTNNLRLGIHKKRSYQGRNIFW